jgi:hypothetical protein
MLGDREERIQTMTNAQMDVATTESEARNPSVCMPTWRRFEHAAYQAGSYEAQDVLADVCELELIPVEPASGFRAKEYVYQRLAWRDPTGTVIRSNPGLQPVTLDKDYDLFIAHCQTVRELLYLNGVRGWKDRARRSACLLAELYANEVRASANLLKALRDYDFVFTELLESAPVIADAIGKPCVCLPPAVDAIRFAPHPNPPDRVVDVYSFGRRREPIHAELMKASRSNEMFYLYDTLAGGASARVRDHRAHRELIAGIAKRSRCFVVAPAKWDEPTQTRGQVAIANRYFEGAAAGAVLIGQASDTEEFRELFDWKDVVVPIAEDGSDVLSVVRELKEDHARRSEISRRNAAETLVKHDWSARWRQLLEVTGTKVGPAMLARESRLKSLASAISAG